MTFRDRGPLHLISMVLVAATCLPVCAGSDLNEVGALLVFPAVIALQDAGTQWETFVTITNASATPVRLHVSYVNGDETAWDYCYECDFSIPLTGFDTETMVVTPTVWGISIESEDGTVSQACPHRMGMIVVSLEDSNGQSLTNNVMLGSAVVVNYGGGFSYSIPAIPFQGRNASDGDRNFRFDDNEYGKMPRIVAAEFLAPDLAANGVTADVALFTLGFRRQFPPEVDCTVTGYDAAENPFSRSVRFGCWSLRSLCDIHPEFCYPNLGLLPGQRDTHGWFKFSCRVDSDRNGSYETNGGVHGVLIQTAPTGAILRRGTAGANAVQGALAWSNLLFQSVTSGGALTLELSESGGGMD